MEEIRVVTLYDEESDAQKDFELAGSCELEGKTYWLLAALPEEETKSGMQDDDDEDDEDVERSEAYLFRLCDQSEAEFTAILEGQKQYVTIEKISDEEYDQVVQIFSQSDEYDLEIEEEEV
ncbi:MAG: DUF1292 domain-containing protein [Lachnospirales bacterium]